MSTDTHSTHADSEYASVRKTFWMAEARDRAEELGMAVASEAFLENLARSLEAQSRCSLKGVQ